MENVHCTHASFFSRLLEKEKLQILDHDAAYAAYGVYSQDSPSAPDKTYLDYTEAHPKEKTVSPGQPVPMRILRLQNVYLINHIGLFTEDAMLLDTVFSGIHNSTFIQIDNDTRTATLTQHGKRLISQGKVKNADACFFINTEQYNHYGHFVLEALPRLWAMRFLPENTPIFTTSSEFGWSACLHALGYEVKRAWSGVGAVFFSDAYVATQPYFINRYCTEEARSMWSSIGHYYYNLLDTPPQGGKYYISRKNIQTNRVLLEEDMLAEMCHRKSFLSVTPEDRSFFDQLALFLNSSAIIGPHGSALFTGLFMQNKVSMFVLAPSEHFVHYFPCFGDNISLAFFCGEKATPLNAHIPLIQSYCWQIPEKDKFLLGLNRWIAQTRCNN